MKVLVSVSFVKAVFDSVWKEIRDLFGLALRRPSAIKKSQNKKQSKIGKKKKKTSNFFLDHSDTNPTLITCWSLIFSFALVSPLLSLEFNSSWLPAIFSFNWVGCGWFTCKTHFRKAGCSSISSVVTFTGFSVTFFHERLLIVYQMAVP